MNADSTAPTRFDRYQVVRLLGKGGMGTVYLAQDTRLPRQVAIKVPRVDEVGERDRLIELFLREVRLASSVQHPNLCPVLDLGDLDGVPYLVMPFIDGPPLSRMVDEEHPWPSEAALALVRQLALAVQVIHDKGIVHRDLKPNNVLMRTPHDPVLVDFGLAKALAVQNQVTIAGQFLGTPAYLAPEQIKNEGISGATDVYSLGVILYELLTGVLPFMGPSVAVCAQILYAEVKPPSQRRPGLDPRLDGLCLKAMARRSSERFATMSEFARAIERCQHPAASTAMTAFVMPTTIPPPAHDPPGLDLVRMPCPNCGKRLKLPRWAVGTRVRCPRCQATVEVSPAMVDTPMTAHTSLGTAAGAGPRLKVPPAIEVPAGGSVSVELRIDRQGYRGPIEVRLIGLPEGIKSNQAFISTTEDRTLLELSAEPGLPASSCSILVLAIGAAGERPVATRLQVTAPAPEPELEAEEAPSVAPAEASAEGSAEAGI